MTKAVIQDGQQPPTVSEVFHIKSKDKLDRDLHYARLTEYTSDLISCEELEVNETLINVHETITVHYDKNKANRKAEPPRPPIIEQIVMQDDSELPDLPTSLPPLPPHGRSRSINRLTHSSIEVTTVLDNKTTVTGITVRSESADRFSMTVDYPSTQPPLTPEEPIEEDTLNEGPVEPLLTKQNVQEPVLVEETVQEPVLTKQNIQEPVLIDTSMQEPVLTVPDEVPELFMSSSSFSEDIYDLNNIEYNRKFNSKRKPNIIECADPEVGVVAQEPPTVPQVELVDQKPSPVDPKDFFVKSFIKPLVDEAEHDLKRLKKPIFKQNQLLSGVPVVEEPIIDQSVRNEPKGELVKPASLELDNTKPNFKKTQLLNRLKKPSLSQIAVTQPVVDVEAKKPSFKQSLIVNKAAKPVESPVFNPELATKIMPSEPETVKPIKPQQLEVNETAIEVVKKPAFKKNVFLNRIQKPIVPEVQVVVEANKPSFKQNLLQKKLPNPVQPEAVVVKQDQKPVPRPSLNSLAKIKQNRQADLSNSIKKRLNAGGFQTSENVSRAETPVSRRSLSSTSKFDLNDYNDNLDIDLSVYSDKMSRMASTSKLSFNDSASDLIDIDFDTYNEEVKTKIESIEEMAPAEPLSRESRSASRSDILVVDAAPDTIDIDFDAYDETPVPQLQSFPTLTNLISNLNLNSGRNENESSQGRGGNIKKFFGDWNSLLNDEEEIGIVASPLKTRLDTGAEADIDEDIVKDELNRLKIVKPIANTSQLNNLRQLQLQQFQRKQQELERQQQASDNNQITSNQVSHSGSNVDVTDMNLIRNLRSKFKHRSLADQERDAAFHIEQGQQRQQQHNHQGHHAPAGKQDELVERRVSQGPHHHHHHQHHHQSHFINERTSRPFRPFNTQLNHEVAAHSRLGDVASSSSSSLGKN